MSAKGLEACSVCNEPLQLKNITEQKRYGLASLLYVQCECSNINNVYTGKSHRPTGSHQIIVAFIVTFMLLRDTLSRMVLFVQRFFDYS